MTMEKPTGTKEKLVIFGGRNLLRGFLTIPSRNGKVSAVIAAHGFAGTKSQRKFVEMGRVFAKNGIAFLRFDFSGCGDSFGEYVNTGISEWFSDFSSAYRFLYMRKEIDRGRIGFLGYSLGAVIACSYIKNSGVAIPARALALIAPALDQKGLMKLWYTPAQLKRWQEQGYLDTPKVRLGERYRLNVEEDYTYLASEIAVPTLVIRGGQDIDVPGHFTKRTFDALLGKKELVTVKEADHGFESYSAKEQLIAHSLKWFQKYL